MSHSGSARRSLPGGAAIGYARRDKEVRPMPVSHSGTARSTPNRWTRTGLVLAIGLLLGTAACGDPAPPATATPSTTAGTRQPVPRRTPTVPGRPTTPAPPASGFAGTLDPTF